jgi:hypothetical protein
MPLIEIKNWTGEVLHTIKADSIKAAVKVLIKRGADLRGANLTGANLRGANLTGAYLRGADLRDANLTGANLTGANLRDANLTGANLTGANLRDADLRDAKYGDGIPLTKQPIFIFGLKWDVMVLDTHLKIGCELHPFTEWEINGDKIAANHNEKKWWGQHKEVIFALIKATR